LSARVPFTSRSEPLARSRSFGNGDPRLLQRVLGSLGRRWFYFILPFLGLTDGHLVRATVGTT